MLISSNFNSHAHVERDLVEVTGLEPTANFNSHAHVERDLGTANATTTIHDISTHTLTWSVTIKRLRGGDNNGYFNSHAHVERDPYHFICPYLCIWDFNSHAHVERDCGRSMPTGNQRDFNSHAHVERDFQTYA